MRQYRAALIGGSAELHGHNASQVRVSACSAWRDSKLRKMEDYISKLDFQMKQGAIERRRPALICFKKVRERTHTLQKLYLLKYTLLFCHERLQLTHVQQSYKLQHLIGEVVVEDAP